MSDQAKRVPLNTTELARRDPSMQGWVLGGNPAAIEAQEAGGQRLFVQSDTLPRRANDYGEFNSQEVLEAAGVRFGADVQGDPMFRYVALPRGWKKVPTSHSMWSDLVDEKGRKRASIFYKAAFYDRDAFYSASRRYSTRVDYERRERDGVTVAIVLDGETVIHTTGRVKKGADKYELAERAQKIADEWLDEHFPEWKNPGSYWD